MNSLIRRIVGSKPKRLDLVVTVYSRTHCSCCHKAIDVLQMYQRDHGFTIEIVDIDSDPALVEAYGSEIPVVAFDGKVRFKGVVNPALLNRLIEAEPTPETK